MENTGPFLFDNIDDKYFVLLQGSARGPFTSEQVYGLLQNGEVSLLDYLWREGLSDWKRICDEKDFSVLIPKKPDSQALKNLKDKLAKKRPPAPVEEAKNYYLYFNRTQYGPFSNTELIHVLQSGRTGASGYLWTPGWANWKRISEVKEFSSYVSTPETGPVVRPAIGKKKSKSKTPKKARVEEKTMGVRLAQGAGIDASERRRAPRRPLVARLFLHNDQEVIIAVCRDISIGGMQVLTDRIPGEVGSYVKLNVSPGDPGKVKGFVAEGEIVRVLEDGRGFSFRFRKISEEARKAIEAYIKTDHL